MEPQVVDFNGSALYLRPESERNGFLRTWPDIVRKAVSENKYLVLRNFQFENA